MLMLTPAQPSVKRLSDVRLEALLPQDRIHQSLRDSGHRFRRRRLSPGLSVHLFLLQLLHQLALEGLRHLGHTSATASALCQARARLPLSLFYALIEQVAATGLAATGLAATGLAATGLAATGPLQPHVATLFHGLQVVLLDGTSTRTPDTPELAGHYRKHTNQRHLTPGYPAPKFLCLMDYATGLIRRAIDLPACRQEHMLLRRVIRTLHPGQILLADRGLVSFPFLAALLGARVHACLRLPQGQLAQATGRRRHVQALGPGDQLVCWQKADRPTKAYSRRAHAALPASLQLRQITWQVLRAGFRPVTMTLITTLTDPTTHPAAELAQLYLQRWQVEVYFRDLKRSQGLGQLRSQTPAGVKKELLAHVLLYNLVRLVMQEAAARQQVPPHRISFLDALRHLRYAAADAAAVGLKVHPRRTRPGEPRRIKTRRAKYPPLNQPRAAYKQCSENHAQNTAPLT